MHPIETKNARIVDTYLGIEDHGILTWRLDFDYGGAGQSFGGYTGDQPNPSTRGLKRVGRAEFGTSIRALLDALGLRSWEQLKGQVVRVVASNMNVHKVGHIINDNWFDYDYVTAAHRED